MDRILARKSLLALRPIDEEGVAVLSKLKADETVVIEIKRARSPQQHRLFWALVDLIYRNQERYATREQLASVLKCAVGWCDEVTLKDGRVMAIPKSIAFANMAQTEFNEFFNKVVELTVTKILPNTGEGDLRRELDEMLRMNP